MTYEVQYTEAFAKELKVLAKKYPSLKTDLVKLVDILEREPFQGTPLGKNCFKIRLAIGSKGKGKSAGARIISHILVEQTTVYLISIYDKSAVSSITNTEIKLRINKLKG